MWPRFAAPGLRWIPTLLLLWIALHPRHPYLTALHAVELPLLAGASGIGIGLALRRCATGQLGCRESGLLIGLLATTVILVVAGDVDFRHQRQEVLAADAAVRGLGQHFIIGYTSFDEVATLAGRGLIGGIYLGRGNVRGRTLSAVRGEIDALQDRRAQAGLPRLIVAADQEGGAVSHMTPPLAELPPLAALVEAGPDAALEARSRAFGEAQGRGLAALGVNLNLAPVADLRPPGSGPRFDTHTLIRRRAIAADPAIVQRVVSSYGEALMAAGVRPTLKHFPGLGQVTTDTHHFPARLEQGVELLAASDWRPFRAAAHSGAALMLAHVTLPAIDPAYPASLSKAVVQGLLRREWDYQGLLLTDDLNMGAVYRLGIGHAAVAALDAGVDMLLISYDPDQYYRAMHAAAAALRRGTLDPAQLAASRQRIAAAAAEGAHPVRMARHP